MMNIKIGFNENQREVVIALEENQQEQVSRLREGLRSGEDFIELADANERTYFINVAEVAYVEIGNTARNAVGFGGA